MSSQTDHVGRVYIVTGGAKGLGRGIVRAMAAVGASVAIVGRDGDAARQAAAEVNSENRANAEAICADVGRPPTA